MDQSAQQALWAWVVDNMASAVLALDADLNVLATNAAARALLGDEILPPFIERGVLSCLEALSSRNERRSPSVRVEAPDHRVALFLTCERVSIRPIDVVVWMQREVLRDVDLLAALRQQVELSAREFQLISLIRVGKSNAQIAHVLGLAESTVKSYLHRLFDRLAVKSRGQLLHLVERLRDSSR
jgi:DNA-binding CsgD family transcriptional regulator